MKSWQGEVNGVITKGLEHWEITLCMFRLGEYCWLHNFLGYRDTY
jgi:hypothetical protein